MPQLIEKGSAILHLSHNLVVNFLCDQTLAVLESRRGKSLTFKLFARKIFAVKSKEFLWDNSRCRFVVWIVIRFKIGMSQSLFHSDAFLQKIFRLPPLRRGWSLTLGLKVRHLFSKSTARGFAFGYKAAKGLVFLNGKARRYSRERCLYKLY